MAGRQGVEPRYAGPEPAVLPYDYLPTDPAPLPATGGMMGGGMAAGATAGNLPLMSSAVYPDHPGVRDPRRRHRPRLSSSGRVLLGRLGREVNRGWARAFSIHQSVRRRHK